MLDVNIHKTNRVVLALKRKKQRLELMRKKSNNTALPCLRETWECNTFEVWTVGIQKLTTKILGGSE